LLSSFLEGHQPMKRFLASALIVGVSTFGLVGCEDKAETKVKETTTTPGGTTTTTTGKTVESTGSNPPANSAGETAKPADAPK
jgi:hypothetical protein